mmetsp:Transcript_3950/g.6001  ORF Transcript_3950/g.6001 Transcript_3950/m.6001 type:complete len:300 (-) Transcript_3950:84-983(-)
MIIVLIFCPDTPLGRLDYASLSQKALVEMAIQKITNRQKLCGSKKHPKDIAKWKGVKMNGNDEVKSISWSRDNWVPLFGTLRLEWLPSTITHVEVVSFRGLRGTIDMSKLPESLLELTIIYCAFTGEIDFRKLAPPIELVSLEVNDLSGTLDLEHLPETIKDIAVDRNNFSGTINLTKLPASITRLSVQQNQLTGQVDLTRLPPMLEELQLSNNKFVGKPDFTQLPESLHTLLLSATDLEGTIFLDTERDYFEAEGTAVIIYNRVYAVKGDHSDRTLLTGEITDEDVDTSCTRAFYIRR